ncbi:Protein STRUBBELIG [Glycine max]|nr:Protein STRUBBELIG [Glycine max]
MANFTSLQILNVVQNHIFGNIPDELPLSLKTLNLSSNTFSELYCEPLSASLGFERRDLGM